MVENATVLGSGEFEFVLAVMLLDGDAIFFSSVEVMAET